MGKRVNVMIENPQVWAVWEKHCTANGSNHGVVAGKLLEKAILSELGLEYKTTIKTVVEPGILFSGGREAPKILGEKK